MGPSRVRSRPLVTQHHFDASRGLMPTVMFVETLVPLMVVAPKAKVGLPLETAVGLLSGASVVELLDGSLLQPAITMVADMTPMMIAFFIKRNENAQRCAAKVSGLKPRRDRRIRWSKS
jgi:hypothetical protein